MKKAILFLIIMVFLAAPAWAANAVVNGEGQLKVTLDGSTDFVWTTATITAGLGVGQKVSTYYPNGIALTSIDFQGPAAAAVGSWRNKTTTGQVMSPPFNTIDGGPQTKYMTGKWMRKPCLVNSEQTTPTGAIWFFNFDPQ